MEELRRLLDDGLELPHIEALASTLMCSSRCRFNKVNKLASTEKGGNVFLDHLDVVDAVNPTIFYAEMARNWKMG